jgi:hypothetical protein
MVLHVQAEPLSARRESTAVVDGSTVADNVRRTISNVDRPH